MNSDYLRTSKLDFLNETLVKPEKRSAIAGYISRNWYSMVSLHSRIIIIIADVRSISKLLLEYAWGVVISAHSTRGLLGSLSELSA